MVYLIFFLGAIPQTPVAISE